MFKRKSRRWMTEPKASHFTLFFIVVFHGFPYGLSQTIKMKRKLEVGEVIVSASDCVCRVYYTETDCVTSLRVFC
jgi:uncharacterized protein YfiM (DUF2279 family)